MSYCRWSTDDFGCDLYCYDDCAGGITTHVASRKVVGDVPKETDLMGNLAEYLASHKAQMEFLETAERVQIGLPHDGETFNDDDQASFLDRLIYLQGLGYRLPQYVIDGLKEDIAASTQEAQ